MTLASYFSIFIAIKVFELIDFLRDVVFSCSNSLKYMISYMSVPYFFEVSHYPQSYGFAGIIVSRT